MDQASKRQRASDQALSELAENLSTLLHDLHLLAESRSTDADGLAARIGEHLGIDPKGLPVIAQELPPYQLVDVQVALEVWAESKGRSQEVIGISGDQRRFHPLSELLSGARFGVGIGPVTTLM